MDSIIACHGLIDNISYARDENNITYFSNTHSICLKYDNKSGIHVCLVDNGNYFANHIIRLLKITFNDKSENLSLKLSGEDILFDMLCKLKELLSVPYNRCTICNTKLTFCLNKPSTCSDKCKITSYGFVTDNIVTDTYKKDKIVFDFLIQSTLAAVDSPRRDIIFEPFPPQFIVGDTKQYDLIAKLIPDDYIKIVKVSENDSELFKVIGKDAYGLMKFIIQSNNTLLVSEKTSLIVNDKYTNKVTDEGESLQEAACHLQIMHNIDKESQFKTDNPVYLFHGSNIANWHSILRNGIKNCSGTKLQVNGAAHGQGIYLSDSINMSFGYSTKGEKKLRDITILGIVQVLGDIESYRSKSPNILVVPDESKILLRYLLIKPKSETNFSLETISSYFRKKRTAEINASSSAFNSITIKRIIKECQDLEKYSAKSKRVIILPIGNDLRKVCKIAYTSKIDSKLDLIFEINFYDNFPIDPPFVRLVDSLSCDSSYIGENGIICIDSLTYKSWKAKIKMSSIVANLVEIFDNITYSKTGTVYSYDNAYNSYKKYIELSK
jgi:ubiquitin-protein ligase